MDINQLYNNCIELAEKIQNKLLRSVALNWLKSNEVVLKGVKGSDWQHHNYAGGLIVHIYNVTEIARNIAYLYKDTISMDIVTFCALMHDAGKIEDYSLNDTFECNQEISSNQSLLGHSYEGARAVEVLLKAACREEGESIYIQNRKLIEQCVHCIGSHMIGYGAISEQKMLEVFILGKADHIDAEMNQTIINEGQGWIETASGHRYYKAAID